MGSYSGAFTESYDPGQAAQPPVALDALLPALRARFSTAFFRCAGVVASTEQHFMLAAGLLIRVSGSFYTSATLET